MKKARNWLLIGTVVVTVVLGVGAGAVCFGLWKVAQG